MHEKTLRAFADHGEVKGDQVTTKYDEAREVMANLEKVGIDYDDVIETLEQEGVEKFVKSWDELVEAGRGQLSQGREQTRWPRPSRSSSPGPRRTRSAPTCPR